MKLQIIGNGSFGSFLSEILAPHFELCEDAESVILATPLSSYEELGKKFKNKHLINVCSVQEPSTNILLKYTDRVTSIHPLFGRRTPENKRNSFLTRSMFDGKDDHWELENSELNFLTNFSLVSTIVTGKNPAQHDQLMAKTHVAALLAAQQMKVFTDRVKDIPDEFIPNSFRLLRDFVKTLDDMPQGTVESIMANPYF